MTVYKTCLVALICFCLSEATAQSIGYFDHYGITDGLSQSTVVNMVQDKLGFVWMGTQDGLNRYNGIDNTVFTNESFQRNTLLGNHVMDMTTDLLGNIWVVTMGGIDCVNPLSLGVKHIVDLNKYEKFQRVSKIWFIDTTLFVSTERGIYKSNSPLDSTIQFTEVKNNLRCNDIFVLYYAQAITRTESILSTSCGLARITQDAMTIESWTGFEGVKHSRAAMVINDQLLYADGGNLFCYGLLQTSNSTQVMSCESIINAIAKRSNGEIWVGTEGEGVYVLSPCGASFELQAHYYFDNQGSDSFRCNYVTCFVAENGLSRSKMWIGTRDDGAYCYDGSKNLFVHFSRVHKLGESTFFGITQDVSGDIWVSDWNNVYHVSTGGEVRSADIRDLVQKIALPVEDLYCDSSNQIWFGHGDNLYRINRKTYQCEIVRADMFGGKTNQVYQMLELNKRKILLGTSLGLAIYDIKTGELDTMSVLGKPGSQYKVSRISAMYIDRESNWWIKASLGGLVYYNIKDKTAQLYRHDPSNPQSLISNLVLAINQMPDGRIIVGTAGGISILQNRDLGIFQSFSKTHGLHNSYVYSVLPDNEGRIWASTNNGVHLFDPVKQAFRCYNANSGAFINEFNSGGYCTTREGKFLFCGIGGVVEIDPKAVQYTHDSLPVYAHLSSSGLNVSVDTYSGARYVELQHSASDIEVRAEIPAYFDDELLVVYRIKELDTTWKKMRRGEVFRQVNLAPGDYTLMISALDPTGQSNFRISEFEIRVLPPFYSTAWFYLVSICVSVLTVVLIYGWIHKRRSKRKLELEEVRMQESERVRQAAAMDLHDEFGNGLTRISLLIEMIRDKLPDNIEEARKELDLVSENSKRLYNGTKDFIWSVNPANESLYETIIRIKDYADELFSGSSIRFELKELEVKLHEVKNHPAFNRNLVMIFKEALSNILKHSQATHVELRVYSDGEYMCISVRDNGIGFDLNKMSSTGYGVGNIVARAKKISASAEYASEPGKGTRLTLKFKGQ